MGELEEKLSALMSNPELMQQIASMAQAMGESHREPEEKPSLPDPGMLQMLSRAASQSGVDGNQQALLQALSPYLSRRRVQKLERAMRAAKLAGTASAFLNAGGLQMLTGR